MCSDYGRRGIRDQRVRTAAHLFMQNRTQYRWELSMQRSDPCGLWCKGIPNDKQHEEVLLKVVSTVPDGSRCELASRSMCVEGKCYVSRGGGRGLVSSVVGWGLVSSGVGMGSS